MIYPLPAKSRGDAESRIIAQEAFVTLLQADPRVARVYQDWRRTSGLAALLEGMNAGDPTARYATGPVVVLCSCASIVLTQLTLPALLTRLPADVRYAWLSERLAAAFLAQIGHEAQPGSLGVAVGVVTPPGAPRGRRAKGAGASIRRNVEWFYRVHVLEPPESIRAIAGEYRRTAPALGLTPLRADKRKSDARSIVQEGIARARALLV